LIGLTVLSDNATRWNSTYNSIHRALKLRRRITDFCKLNQNELAKDTLSETEWEYLKEMEIILKPFQQVTKALEGNSEGAHHGSIWETLPAIEILLRHMEKKKEQHRSHPYLATCTNLAWAKLEKYYKIMDNTPIYGAALFLHPNHRFKYFKQKWTTKALKAYQKSMLDAIRLLYNEQYAKTSFDSAIDASSEEEIEMDIVRSYLHAGMKEKDEFEAYLQGAPTQLADDANLYQWWATAGSPRLAQMAYDLLSIPAMSAETERVFSGAKLTISPNRNRLTEDIIEATDCLKRWYKAGY